VKRAAAWCIAVALPVLGACSSHQTAQDASLPPTYAIDAGFLFGVGTAAYAVEGGNHDSDWYLWEQVPLPLATDGGSDGGTDGGCRVLGCARADDGPDHYDQVAQDLALAKDAGVNAYRFSLSWGRLRPLADGGYDPAQIAHYHAVLDACQSGGLTPMVTLTDFSLPLWVQGVSPGRSGATEADWSGGWRGLPGETPGRDAGIVQAFGTFAGDMATEYGKQVDLWITESSPSTLVAHAYIDGAFPPGAQDHLTDARNAIINLAYANGAAYDAIHRNDTFSAKDGGPPALVGVAQELRTFLPAPGGPDGGNYVDQMSYIDNWLFLFAVVNGDLDTHFDGSYYHSGDGHGEGTGLVGLAGRADFLGVNYYGPALATYVAGGITDAQGSSLTLPASVGENPDPIVPHGDAPESRQIDPQGLHDALLLAHNLFSLLPIYVTENGVADGAMPDTKRPAYLVQHVQAMQQAMAEGVPVVGYFPWSFIDTYQWNVGFAPRYGLFRVDFSQAGRPRSPTQGVEAYGQVIGALGVTPSIAMRWVADGGGI
jgi:beta-glucosidase